MAPIPPEETAGGSLGKSQEQPLHPCPKQTIRCAAPFGTSAPTIGLFWTNTARGLQGGLGRVALAAGFMMTVRSGQPSQTGTRRKA